MATKIISKLYGFGFHENRDMTNALDAHQQYGRNVLPLVSTRHPLERIDTAKQLISTPASNDGNRRNANTADHPLELSPKRGTKQRR